MPRTKSLAAAALAAVALTGVAAQSASADSISYVKDGNVWLSTTDGARQFQVTSGGGYSSASQSDDGTIVAVHGGQRIHKLDRLGNVLADFTTAVSDGLDDTKTYGASHFEGPYDVDLSPDGKKLTYNFYWQQWTNFGSPYGTWYHYLRQGVGVSYSDRTTSWEEPGLGNQTGWLDAGWYDDDSLVLGKKASAGMMDIALDDLGTTTSDSQNWFHQGDVIKDLRAPAVNRQHTRVAVVGDSAEGELMVVYRMTGEGPKALPVICHGWNLEKPGTHMSSPSWSPDGTKLVWAEPGGVYVGEGAECPTTQASRLLIPGAADPDWSAADVPTSRPAPPAPQPQPQPDTKTKTVPTVKPAPKDDPRVTKTTAGTSIASIACRRKCTITGKVVVPKKLAKTLGLKRGATLATGTARASKKGSVKLTLTANAAGRKALAKLAGVKLQLRVTIKEGGRTRRVTRTVTLA